MQSENTLFLWSLLKALLALTLSAAILIPSSLALSPELKKYREAATSDDIRPRVITGRDLIVRIGSGTTTKDQALNLTALADDGEEGRALLTRKISLQASDYPFIEYIQREHRIVTAIDIKRATSSH